MDRRPLSAAPSPAAMIAPLLLPLIPLPATLAPPAARPLEPGADDAFGDVWYDGRAELSGYRWSGVRYGERRTGEAVAIFVTEPFGTEEHVKIDRGRSASGEVVTALKLNLVRDFQTGVYDYDTMTSVFVRADDLTPMKVSFTSAEWCGHVYEQLDVREDGTHLVVHSYFQGESAERVLARRPDGLLGDQLLIALRGLHGPLLAPGESVRRPFLPGAFERRLRHRSAAWGEITIERAAETRTVEVPAGRFEAIAYRAETADGRTCEVDVGAEYPHRILRWSWRRGDDLLDSGELTGTRRLSYWEHNGEEDGRLRASLGLGS